MQKLKFFIGIIAIMLLAIGFSSCEKESALQNSDNTLEYTQNPANDFSIEIVKIDTIDNSEYESKSNQYTVEPWGYYNGFQSTSINGEYFSPGTYAVQIKRKNNANNPLRIYVYAQGCSNDKIASLWEYIFDSSYNQIYSSGYQTFDDGQQINHYFDIYGSNILVLLLHITEGANYIVYYHTSTYYGLACQ